MGEYHHVACHDCRVWGMLPKTSVPDIWYKAWKEQSVHADHNTSWASEYDDEFMATVHGERITSYVSVMGEYPTERVGEPYRCIDHETMDVKWREADWKEYERVYGEGQSQS